MYNLTIKTSWGQTVQAWFFSLNAALVYASKFHCVNNYKVADPSGSVVWEVR